MLFCIAQGLQVVFCPISLCLQPMSGEFVLTPIKQMGLQSVFRRALPMMLRRGLVQRTADIDFL